MAIDRQGTALAVLRICIGVFFVFEGLGKIRWFVDSSILTSQLAGWHGSLAAGSISARYIEHLAMPGAVYFARLVPLGELSVGLALVAGFWTPVAAFVGFLMSLGDVAPTSAIASATVCSRTAASTAGGR